MTPCDKTPPTPAETFLTEYQVAARHGVSVKTLRNQRLRGGTETIPFIKLGARLVRYRLTDIEAWEKAHLRRSTSDVGGEHG